MTQVKLDEGGRKKAAFLVNEALIGVGAIRDSAKAGDDRGRRSVIQVVSRSAFPGLKSESDRALGTFEEQLAFVNYNLGVLYAALGEPASALFDNICVVLNIPQSASSKPKERLLSSVENMLKEMEGLTEKREIAMSTYFPALLDFSRPCVVRLHTLICTLDIVKEYLNHPAWELDSIMGNSREVNRTGLLLKSKEYEGIYRIVEEKGDLEAKNRALEEQKDEKDGEFDEAFGVLQVQEVTLNEKDKEIAEHKALQAKLEADLQRSEKEKEALRRELEESKGKSAEENNALKLELEAMRAKMLEVEEENRSLRISKAEEQANLISKTLDRTKEHQKVFESVLTEARAIIEKYKKTDPDYDKE